MTDFLESIDEITNKNKFEPDIFITSYNQNNLDLSIKLGILGWKRRPKHISKGYLVFVYNSTSKRIQAGFKIKEEYNDIKPLWHDETMSVPPIVIYIFVTRLI
jgi:hypothetical protein